MGPTLLATLMLASQLDVGAGVNVGVSHEVGTTRRLVLGGVGASGRAEFGGDLRLATFVVVIPPTIAVIPGELPGVTAFYLGLPITAIGAGVTGVITRLGDTTFTVGVLGSVGTTAYSCGDCFGITPTFSLAPDPE